MFFLVSSSLFVELFILLTLVCVCVCVYHLPGCELADVCECARTCSCTARPDSLPPWFLRFSFRLLTTSSLSLCFDVSLCGFCRVCVLAGRWLGPDALELVTDPDRGRGGGLWMEGPGCLSEVDTCPAGTTQAPTSCTQVRRHFVSLTSFCLEKSSCCNGQRLDFCGGLRR